MKTLVLTSLLLMAIASTAQQIEPIIIIDTANSRLTWNYEAVAVNYTALQDSSAGYVSLNNSVIWFTVKKTKVVLNDTVTVYEQYAVPLINGQRSTIKLFNKAAVKRYLKQKVKENSIRDKIYE
jgi:hypothetical protein